MKTITMDFDTYEAEQKEQYELGIYSSYNKVWSWFSWDDSELKNLTIDAGRKYGVTSPKFKILNEMLKFRGVTQITRTEIEQEFAI